MSLLLHSIAAYNRFLHQQPVAAVYFSAPDCGVCRVLKPQLMTLLQQYFPRLAFAEVDCAAAPEVAAQYGVYAVPVLIIYFEGQELLRKVRNFSPSQLADELGRPYALYFDA